MMFQKKRFDRMWESDTMADVIRYYQVFSNGTLFEKIYPVYIKSDYGFALKKIITELGFPEKINIYGSNSQNAYGT